MHAFDFIMLFFSFIYALALTHLLLAVNTMIRSRRNITFSVPHAIWMFDAFLAASINWISLWDFHDMQLISLGAIAGGFVLGIAQYLVCALVSPHFKDEVPHLRPKRRVLARLLPGSSLIKGGCSPLVPYVQLVTPGLFVAALRMTKA